MNDALWSKHARDRDEMASSPLTRRRLLAAGAGGLLALGGLGSVRPAVAQQSMMTRLDYVGINTTRPPFDDQRLRQAMNYAINKEEIVAQVLDGAGRPATTLLPHGVSGHDPAARGYPFNLEQARALVAQSAGRDGFTAELIIPRIDPIEARMSLLVAAHLKQIGGNVTGVFAETYPDYYAILAEGRFDLYKNYIEVTPDAVWEYPYQAAWTIIAFLIEHEDLFFQNWTGYESEVLDDLHQQAYAEMVGENGSPTRVAQILNQLQRAHAEAAPLLFLTSSAPRELDPAS
jgi:peptide/nickel transport system substrate-binding protein